MIPAGPHFIAYSAVSKQQQVSPPVWFFLHVRPREVIVRRWDSISELLLPLEDEDEVSLAFNIPLVAETVNIALDLAWCLCCGSCRLAGMFRGHCSLISIEVWLHITYRLIRTGNACQTTSLPSS